MKSPLSPASGETAAQILDTPMMTYERIRFMLFNKHSVFNNHSVVNLKMLNQIDFLLV